MPTVAHLLTEAEENEFKREEEDWFRGEASSGFFKWVGRRVGRWVGRIMNTVRTIGTAG